MIWYTADQHFGHENMIKYCNRPFMSAAKMDNAMIDRYRKVVSPEDTVYFLGDFSIKGPQYLGYHEYIMKQLPGNKILILGNHDKVNPFTYMELGFLHVHTVLDIGSYVLVHDPAMSVVDDSRLWLCGHVHTVFKMGKRGTVLNVGVDQWGFYPVSEEEVRKEFGLVG